MVSTEQNKAIVREFLAESDRGNTAVIDRIFAPNFQAYFSATPGPVDRAAFKKFLLYSRQGLPDGRHGVEGQVAEEGLVATSGTLRERTRANSWGCPQPTDGRPCRSSCLPTWRTER